MHIHCFQHVFYETPGTILEWVEQHNHTIGYTYFFGKNYVLPALNEFDCLLVMGGPMNVDEEEKFPWLKEEKRLIKAAIDTDKKVIGICFGSQLLAAALNKRVYKAGEREIGFFPIIFTNEALQYPAFNHFLKTYTVFHWHGDTFDLPDKAKLIASTDVCANQAFVIGNNVLGIQFHLEMNKAIIEKMMLHCSDELKEKGEHIQELFPVFHKKHVESSEYACYSKFILFRLFFIVSNVCRLTFHD